MRVFAWFVGALCLTALPAVAATTVYNCALTSAGNRGWIAPQLVIAIPDDRSRAVVADAFILDEGGEPLEGSVMRGGRGASWTLRLIANTGRRISVRYRAELSETGQSVRVYARISARHRETTTGTCQVTREP